MHWSLPQDQASFFVRRCQQATHEIITQRSHRSIMSANLLHHISLESVPVVNAAIAITSKHQGFRGGQTAMSRGIKEIFMLELADWFVHLEVQDLAAGTFETGHKYLMPIRH